MHRTIRARRAMGALALSFAITGATASQAGAHAHLSPSVVQKGSENITLVVPSEGGVTRSVQITVPDGLQIGSFEALPGVKRSVVATGSGDEAVVSQVTWTGLKVPDGEAAYLRFQAQTKNAGTYAVKVKQTYADGKVSNWAGPESSEEPAPTMQAVDSLTGGGGDGGSDTLAIIALILGGLALLTGAGAVLRGGGRSLT